ncbi:CgeB family protein [Thiobacillus denitrificans]|nr:glycosyltransferase [Thiobacillus denitrificans]
MKPRILLVGKSGSIVQWFEDARDGFEDAGAAPAVFALNGNTPWSAMGARLAKLGGRAALERHLLRQLDASLKTVKPDLVVFVQAYWAPAALFDMVRSQGIPAAGWVGDKFGPQAKERASRLDRVYYTDSGFLVEAETFGFADDGAYLPHAVNTRRFLSGDVPRTDRIAFVAVPTPHRVALLQQLAFPIAVYGRGWNLLGRTPHDVHNGWLARGQLPGLYGESLAVLNIRNELNVFEGLNQRSFEPAACATAVIHDYVADLARCFEPGKEVLVFGGVQELQEICERVRRDPALVRRVGAAAKARVQAEHTCAHRAKTILRDFGLECRKP